MAGIMVVIDFDKTIIEVDSATDLFNQLVPTMPWNSVTVTSIGCDLRIVSDANILFFLFTILDHLGMSNCFSDINTNPSYVDEERRRRISPYVDFHSRSRGCTNPCPPNMDPMPINMSSFSRMIVEKIQASLANEGKKRIIYIGDGAGDFCPSLKLKEGDFIMPRKNFPVWDLKCKNRTRLRAKVHEWVDGEELEHVLLTFIEKMSIEGTINSNPAQLLSVHCKSNTIAVAAQEALPPPLK
ncbi:putative haloacid dehalogenase-like hydrolase [Handroanthus impetiginosus]|uniref:Putative haloacid dehalogenase-like hydrolase n=1 Tax=Handroanthus impetiginosus TaxID=429701 RepID=A0A2G9GZ85_9LAMI|nr:putative haloacid dehalogenase-like hydrolase [Handroanthus impetiginosus]